MPKATFPKSPLVPIAGLLVAVLIGAGFVLLADQSTEQQPTPSPFPVSTPTPSPNPSPSSQAMPDVPDDWLTYRNEELGFEVRYPSDLTLLQEDASTFVSFGKPQPAFIGDSSLDIKILRSASEKEAFGEARIWTRAEIIQLQRNEPKQFPPDFDAVEFTKTHGYWLFEPVSFYPTPVIEVLVNGQKALIGGFDVRLGDREGGSIGLGRRSMILLFGDDNTYALIYAGFNDDSIVLRQFLSTFRFIQ